MLKAPYVKTSTDVTVFQEKLGTKVFDKNHTYLEGCVHMDGA